MEWQQQKLYWDKVASEKEFRTPLQIELLQRNLNRDDAAILDYGCGYGRILAELQAAGYRHLSGVDLSSAMIGQAQQNCPGVDLRVNYDYQIPFDDNSQDAVLLIAVLTSVPRNQDQINVINEIMRVLKPGGYLYINDFLLNQDERNLERYQLCQERYDCYGVFELPDGGVQRHHDPDWIRQLLSPFNQVVYDETLYTTMNGNPARGFFYLGQLGEL